MKMRNGANNAWISLYELDGTFLAGDISLSAGAAATPSLFFTGDTNTGIYSPGADQVGISTGGTARITIDGSGNVNIDSNTLYVDAANNRVGIGTSAPQSQLSVVGPVGTLNDTGGTLLLATDAAGTDVQGTLGAGVTFAQRWQAASGPTRMAGIYGVKGSGSGFFGGTLAFYTQPASGADMGECLRITAGGNVGIGNTASNANGGILQLSGGITFPATAVAASDPNTLDDYEEGTFTPAVQGSTTAGTATYSTQTGQYTKIGNRVIFNLRIIYTGGTGTGNLRVGGLPFTSNNNMAGAATSIIAENIAGTALYVFTALVGANTTYVGVDQIPTGGGGAIATAYDVAGDIQIAGHYFV